MNILTFLQMNMELFIPVSRFIVPLSAVKIRLDVQLLQTRYAPMKIILTSSGFHDTLCLVAGKIFELNGADVGNEEDVKIIQRR